MNKFVDCGPSIDEFTWELVKLWRKYNRELCVIMMELALTSYVKGQMIQWLGNIMRKQKS